MIAMHPATGATSLQNPAEINWGSLNNKLWAMSNPDKFGVAMPTPRNGARLSQEEWEAIQALILEESIPVTLCNMCFGFSVGMTLWSTRQKPFPGAVEEPRPLITIAAEHILENNHDATFELGWSEFSEFTHSKRNCEILKQNHLPEPGSKASYSV